MSTHRNNEQISIIKLKRLMPPGTRFTATFLGRVNTKVIGNLGVTTLTKPPSDITTERVVLKQGKEMVSEFLTGSKSGKPIYLDWRGVVAREEYGSFILSQSDTGDFLKITLEERS